MPPSSMRIEYQESIQRFMKQIRTFRQHHDWDIADLCLERCTESVRKVVKHQQTRPEGELAGIQATAESANAGSQAEPGLGFSLSEGDGL